MNHIFCNSAKTSVWKAGGLHCIILSLCFRKNKNPFQLASILPHCPFSLISYISQLLDFYSFCKRPSTVDRIEEKWYLQIPRLTKSEVPEVFHSCKFSGSQKLPEEQYRGHQNITILMFRFTHYCFFRSPFSRIKVDG